MHSQQRDRSIEEEEIVLSNSIEIPKKKGRKQPIPKEPKKQTLTKKLKHNMDSQVNYDD